MTRQKKELIRKIDEIERFIGADQELGCGFAPTGFYDPLYEEVYSLETEFAHLRGFESVEAMMMDQRY